MDPRAAPMAVRRELRKAPPSRGPRGTDSPAADESLLAVLKHSGRALGLVWQTSRVITLLLLGLSIAGGVLPAALAYVGKLIVDAVVKAAGSEHADKALHWVAIELGLVLLMAGLQRGMALCDALLRAQLGQRVNELILEKALTLSLSDFEDSEFYDRMTRARRDASWRPLSLVKRALGLAQNTISLALYGALLVRFSIWAVLVLALAAVPAFVAEKSFSEDAFRLLRWRSPETRMQSYLETLLAREDHAKEVTLFRLGPLFLGRYRAIFDKVFGEERALTLKRGAWGYVLGALSTLSFYGAYSYIVLQTVSGLITLGDMTMYLLVFKQGQSALSALLSALGGIYEDYLYLSNLYEYLDHASAVATGTATSGPRPEDGIRFDHVSFAYRGTTNVALRDITLHIPPGSKLALVGEN
ncbi:MAG: ABC-type multidrug transport system, ATPase and permease component, partial [Myxococcaceae bacterium]|nr:ABC-type multidrug transport system, ATPase and permease component [Myxococcaceae bacterium]